MSNKRTWRYIYKRGGGFFDSLKIMQLYGGICFVLREVDIYFNRNIT